MYSLAKISLKFIKYFFTALNGKGHGVHSPFVFDFIKYVLNDKIKYEAYDTIEGVRKKMIVDERLLTIQDFGAGSTVVKGNKRKVNSIAKSSLKPAKYGQLLFRIVQYYEGKNIVELGTSLGVTTAYLAASTKSNTVTTFEGADEVAAVALQNFNNLQFNNIEIIKGNFDDTLPKFLQSSSKIDLAFVDGNHRKQPTLQYFEMLLEKATNNSILVFDDIHWSKEMEEAWEIICRHPSVTLTIDLFFIGLVFFRKEQKKVQHCVIRF